MYKIKIITGNNVKSLEENVNSFLKEAADEIVELIDIKFKFSSHNLRTEKAVVIYR